jgi:hypothetical protein
MSTKKKWVEMNDNQAKDELYTILEYLVDKIIDLTDTDSVTKATHIRDITMAFDITGLDNWDAVKALREFNACLDNPPLKQQAENDIVLEKYNTKHGVLNLLSKRGDFFEVYVQIIAIMLHCISRNIINAKTIRTIQISQPDAEETIRVKELIKKMNDYYGIGI